MTKEEKLQKYKQRHVDRLATLKQEYESKKKYNEDCIKNIDKELKALKK